MKFRLKLILRKGVTLAALVVPVVGCGSSRRVPLPDAGGQVDTITEILPEEAFRAAIDDACDAILACGTIDVPDCATSASRNALVTLIRAELANETEACRDTFFEVSADYYVCYANLSCAEMSDVDCLTPAQEARVDAVCPDLDIDL